MKYDLDYISKLDNSIVRHYELYEEHGTGVVEDPHRDGRTISIIECTEFDAFIVSASMNISRHGFMHQRNSWESPNVRYRLWANNKTTNR